MSLDIGEIQGLVEKTRDDVEAAVKALGHQYTSEFALTGLSTPLRRAKSALIYLREISSKLDAAIRDDFDDWGNLDGA